MSTRPTAQSDLADLLPSIPDDSDSVEQQIAVEQIQLILANALAQVEPDYRQAVLLRDVAGLTAPEAAHRLSISVAALKSRLHRGRDQLREHVHHLQSDLMPIRDRTN